MEINRVTFTGADDNTDPKVLMAIQEKYPNVEWGILFSKDRQGTEKYPSQEWINSLPAELNLSAHFCGWYSRSVLDYKAINLIHELPKSFKRVQLNYTFNDKNKKYGMPFVHHLIKPSNGDNRQLIFQYNKSNKEILDAWMTWWGDDGRLSFLYDSSGGRGLEIKEIQNPFKWYTGYSGGLKPENITHITDLIKNHSNTSDVWIDMEAGVRTDGQFDLEKVVEVLKLVK